MNMKILALLASVVVITFAGCRSSSVFPKYNVNMETERVQVLGLDSAESMRAAIIRAATGRGWRVVSEDYDEIVLSFVKHGRTIVSATVKVTYTAESFAVEYVDSQNLGYNSHNGAISGKYLQWVRNLKKDTYIFAMSSSR